MAKPGYEDGKYYSACSGPQIDDKAELSIVDILPPTGRVNVVYVLKGSQEVYFWNNNT